MTLQVCETYAAIATHYRRLEPGEEPCYTGRKRGSMTICGLTVGWDVTRPDVTCRECLSEAKRILR